MGPDWSRFFYNLLMTIGLIVFAPLLFVKAILTPKYRRRFVGRLGIGPLAPSCRTAGGPPRIWLHALSVGEVASARSLVRALRAEYPQASLIFSSATSAGEGLARESLAGEVDCFVPFPFDVLPSVRRLLSLVAPDLFILVETDFWPNFLAELSLRNIPCLLVNGRVSEESFARYARLHCLFTPMFASFRFLAMQTEADAEAMARLGVDRDRLPVLGNLKYDTVCPGEALGPLPARADFCIPDSALVLVAGSTHPGEEEPIFSSFARLKATLPDLFLVLAPRQVARGAELQTMAARHGLQAARRSLAQSDARPESLLILDSLGELAQVYALADLAFVGGSLVPERGHNPLEPAAFGKAVVFGPFMEDFAEISRDLLAAGGARQLVAAEELFPVLAVLLADREVRRRIGENGRKLVRGRRGVTASHVALIRRILSDGERQ